MKFAAVLFCASILGSIILLNSNTRKFLSDMLLPPARTVLSKLEMKRESQTYKILKVSTREALVVELYKKNGDQFDLIDTHKLTDKKDAHYKFKDTQHNLFLKDINNDGSPEIILPSIDQNMKARLNVFMFDPENELLQKVTQH